jgi:HK97 family phage major capsid protein
MNPEEVKELTEQVVKAQEGVKTLVEKQAQEIKANGETSKATAGKLEEAEKRLDDEMEKLKSRLDAMEAKGNQPNYGDPSVKARTPGQRVVASEQYKNRTSTKMDSVEVGSLLGTKADTDYLGGTVGDGEDRAPVFAERVPELIYDPGQTPLTLRQVLNVAPTGSNAIEFFQEKEFDPKGAKSQNGELGVKSKLAIQFEKKTIAVETISAWLPMSRQVLDDQVMLQSHVDMRLTHAVNIEVERQVLFGSGQDGEVLGIHSTPGIQSLGAPATGNTVIDHLRLAFAAIRAKEYSATALILHPTDFAKIELLKGSDKHYIWVTVPDGGVTRLWRVPVIETTVMEEGRFMTGAFGLGAQLWDRMQSTVRVSEHHEDFFVRNAVAILAEVRAALTVYRPSAFAKGLLVTGLST